MASPGQGKSDFLPRRDRHQTAVDYQQLSAITERTDATHGLRGQVCADGGFRTAGDVAKAFAAGADLVMFGSLLTGHDECQVEWTIE